MKRDSRGFTLIAALLLTLLLSALAVGMLYLVNNEQHMGNNDLENNLSFYGAEAGIENLTAELSQLYQQSQNPSAAALNALTAPANFPTNVTGSNIANMTYAESLTWPATQTNGQPCPNAPNPCGAWDIVGSGQNQGMVASLIQFNLQVTATRQSNAGQISAYSTMAATGASVNLTRTVEVALLPAFEFGVFCDGDCDYFAGPNFNFGGRVHTNGNLFLATGSKLTFTDKIAAVGQVITDQLENGWPTGNGYTGTTYVPIAAGACPPAPLAGPAANCNALPGGSWTGGFPPTGAANPGWIGTSTAFNNFIVNGLTGATKLQLPFVQATNVGPIEIIRRPAPADTALMSSSRLYTKAQIRILLADTLADLHPERGAGAIDADDVQLAGSATVNTGPFNGSSMFYGIANKGNVGNNWTANAPTGCGAIAQWPLLGQVTSLATPCSSVWLRVEFINNAGVWAGVTRQWLQYGFGRSYNQPPTHPYTAGGAIPTCPTGAYPSWQGVTGPDPLAQCQNPLGPAILIVQQLQNTLGSGSAFGGANSTNWLPINFYDAREGEPRDSRPAGDPQTSCSPNGIMNAVELDLGNLWLWLQGAAPYAAGSGTLVNSSNNNGYILYFSDHRGMVPDPRPLTVFYNGISGMAGLNDTVNSVSVNGIPDGALEPITYYATATPPYSPEDTAIKSNGIVDRWGEANLGAGFGLSGANMSQPYYIWGSVVGNKIQCYAPNPIGAPYPGTAEWNMVTGPRHVLRLVDASMDNAGTSYLPHPIAPATSGNGFTVVSEEPVYVWGDFNSGPNDPFWPSENVINTPHSATAIIADSVTLLSNPPSGATVPTANSGWTDVESFLNPGLAGNRPGNTSYYRVAIAAGKSIPFPEPGWATAAGLKDFGTDGGMHNFLRYLENRGANGATVNYAGSLISMYYSQYNTGIFKCCNSVYGAPNRNYFFDTNFLDPNNLPPGTPMFQDVVSLGYHQSFSSQ